MPKCGKCDGHFKTRVAINGVKKTLSNNRKYCLDCSPFGKHNTIRLEKVQKDGNVITCEVCARAYSYSRTAGHTLTVCNSCKTLHRKRKIKAKSIKYKGGKCSSCDYDKCADALTFHHTNVKEKEFSIGGNYNRTWKSIQKELDKCILLCMNCHMKIHHVPE